MFAEKDRNPEDFCYTMLIITNRKKIMSLSKTEKTLDFSPDAVSYKHITARIVGSRVQFQSGLITEKQHASYVEYLMAAQKDVESRLTAQDWLSLKETVTQTSREELIQLQKELDQNKDKPSH